MRYLALAADYDGTLAHHGLVDRETVAALERLGATGRKLILVTGRELDELLGVFRDIGVFHLVVAENGGLLYWPATREVELLCSPPPPAFVSRLRERRVDPLAVGRSIVATVHPNETEVLEAIRALGLELHVIFNKGAVMILPTGVNKASGLAAALDRLGLSPRNVVAVGDAENDHSMLQFAEFGAATANAVPMLKEHADLALAHGHGAGVRELIDAMVSGDLAAHPPRRRAVLLGHDPGGTPVALPAGGANLFIAGASGTGKSVLALGMVERLAAQGYQCCVVDPEGRHPAVGDAVVLGSLDAPPTPGQVAAALEKPDANLVLNLAGVPVADRAQGFVRLWGPLADLRQRLGRPHCIVIDEAHAVLGENLAAMEALTGGDSTGLVCITVHADAVAPAVLRAMHHVAATGADAMHVLRAFAAAAGIEAPADGANAPGPGEALLWRAGERSVPVRLRVEPHAAALRSQRRQYAEGELPESRSFYFRGPDGRLNLRAQNLTLFLQMADGVDDGTWMFHLRRGDYSEWLLNALRDQELALAVRLVEKDGEANPASSRARVREAIEARCRAAAEATS